MADDANVEFSIFDPLQALMRDCYHHNPEQARTYLLGCPRDGTWGKKFTFDLPKTQKGVFVLLLEHLNKVGSRLMANGTAEAHANK